MTTIQDLEERLNSFERSLIQMAQNNTPLVTKVDDTSNKVEQITPYTQTKTAYIDDTEIVFKDVPNGTYNVSFNKSVYATRVLKEDFTDGTSTVTIEFAPLEEVTEVTLTIN